MLQGTPLDSIDTDATIECPRLRRGLILSGVPVIVLVVVTLLVVIGTAPLVLAKKFDLQFFLTAYLLFPVLVVLFSWIVWAILRYREALFTTIRVSDSGIVVQNTRYGMLLLNWNDVHATYSRFGKMVVLESPKLIRPLAIMSFAGGAGGPTHQFLAAKAIVQRSVGERWSEQWLLL